MQQGYWSLIVCLSVYVCVCVSETEDMSSLRLQEDILAVGLPDDLYSDAHPAAWLLSHGKNKPGQGLANFQTCGPRLVVKFNSGAEQIDGVIW